MPDKNNNTDTLLTSAIRLAYLLVFNIETLYSSQFLNILFIILTASDT